VIEGKRKMLVIGLDGAPPELVFEKYHDELPHIKRLMENGAWGKLQSCHPPITVPAWTAMMSSQDPGQLGCYGFRNRVDHGYGPMRIATSRSVQALRVWDILSQAGKQVVVIGVPQTYPVNRVNGVMVSCFLAPSTQNSYTYPDSIRSEIAAVAGEYLPDVRNFRTADKDRLLGQIYEMTEKRFKVVRHFLRTRPWDFFMFVEMGADRLQHGFWKFADPAHSKYEAGNRFENALRDYYRHIDNEIGALLNLLDDDTIVFLLSDHGAKKMEGGVCLNEWLIANGYLVLKNKPEGVVPLAQCEIDWTKTTAWADGGYYGRLFLNVKGREPQGVVEPDDYENWRGDLAAQIAAIANHQGRPLATKTFSPAQLYRRCNGIPPDLLIYFDDLSWRSAGSVGGDRIHTFDNDTGPDEANHSHEGIFVMYDPRRRAGGQIGQTISLFDIAPTMLEAFGMEAPDWMLGNARRKT
jgi:predicted AlkP superfamily phosphohydrolase/phosphomutase